MFLDFLFFSEWVFSFKVFFGQLHGLCRAILVQNSFLSCIEPSRYDSQGNKGCNLSWSSVRTNSWPLLWLLLSLFLSGQILYFTTFVPRVVIWRVWGGIKVQKLKVKVSYQKDSKNVRWADSGLAKNGEQPWCWVGFHQHMRTVFTMYWFTVLGTWITEIWNNSFLPAQGRIAKDFFGFISVKNVIIIIIYSYVLIITY